MEKIFWMCREGWSEEIYTCRVRCKVTEKLISIVEVLEGDGSATGFKTRFTRDEFHLLCETEADAVRGLIKKIRKKIELSKAQIAEWEADISRAEALVSKKKGM
jgi:hypothetical protein